MSGIINFVNQSYFLLWTAIAAMVLWISYTVIIGVIRVREKASSVNSPLIGSQFKGKFGRLLFGHKLVKIIVHFVFLAIFISSLVYLLASKPTVISPANASLEQSLVNPNRPIEVTFSRMIDSEKLDIFFSPELPGSWSHNIDFLTGRSRLVFTPRVSPKNATRYTVDLKSIKPFMFGQSDNYQFTFETPPSPKLLSLEPKDSNVEIMPKDKIKLSFDNDWFDSTIISARVEPAVELAINRNGKEWTVVAKDGFKKGQTYKLFVLQIPAETDYQTKQQRAVGAEEVIYQSSFTVIQAPGVANYGPKGGSVKVNEEIFIEFKQDMNQEATLKSLQIHPMPAGQWQWVSARKVVFALAVPLTKNTSYKILIDLTAQVADGSFFEEKFSYQFTTIGPVTSAMIQPKDKATNVDYGLAVKIQFNQVVEETSAKESFSITPSVNGNLTVRGNLLIFDHESFDAGTYTVKIKQGVIGLEGLPSVQDFQFSFTTKPKHVVLSVPVFRQEHLYTCFSSAVKQALAYRGINVSESEITNAIGFDITPWSGTWRDPNASWGDPDEGIVGNIDGKAPPGWGYGASPAKVAQTMSRYRSIDFKTGFTVQGIAQEINKGNPVIVFWVNGYFPAYEVFWQKNGKKIRGVNSYHVQVVKGFVGSVDNPTALIVNDSGLGYPGRTMDIKTFRSRWGWFGNSAIIVY